MDNLMEYAISKGCIYLDAKSKSEVLEGSDELELLLLERLGYLIPKSNLNEILENGFSISGAAAIANSAMGGDRTHYSYFEGAWWFMNAKDDVGNYMKQVAAYINNTDLIEEAGSQLTDIQKESAKQVAEKIGETPLETNRKPKNLIIYTNYKEFCNHIGNKLYKDSPLSPDYMEIYKKILKDLSIETITTASQNIEMRVVSVSGGYLPMTHLRSVTDVLRWFVVLKDGDVSLSSSETIPKGNYSRGQILLGLGRLEEILSISDDSESARHIFELVRRKATWKYLSGRIHPYKYKNKFPMIANLLSKLWKGKLMTFGDQATKAIRDNSKFRVREIFSINPGELIRWTTRLLNSELEVEFIAQMFFDFYKHFDRGSILKLGYLLDFNAENQDVSKVYSYFTRGRATTHVIPAEEKGTLDERMTSRFSELSYILRKHISKFPPVEFEVKEIEPEDHLIPYGSSSKDRSPGMLPRYSKVKIGEGDTVRLFLHWEDAQEGDETTDMDLSATLVSEDFKKSDFIFFGNLSNECAVHSGDLLFAPPSAGGASEFIDIDIPKASEKYRYVIMDSRAYHFSGVSEVFVGAMSLDTPYITAGVGTREDARSLNMALKAVEFKCAMSHPESAMIPMVFDLKTRFMYVLDHKLSHDFRGLSIAESTESFDWLKTLIRRTEKGYIPTIKDVKLINA